MYVEDKAVRGCQDQLSTDDPRFKKGSTGGCAGQHIPTVLQGLVRSRRSNGPRNKIDGSKGRQELPVLNTTRKPYLSVGKDAPEVFKEKPLAEGGSPTPAGFQGQRGGQRSVKKNTIRGRGLKG